MQALSVLTPPAVEPVALADAKAFLRVTLDDDDAMISGMIGSAREWCENYSSRAFITQTLTLTLDGFPLAGTDLNWRLRPGWGGCRPGWRRRGIALPRPPFQSIVSVSYLNPQMVEQVVPASSYRVVAGSASRTELVTAPNQQWPAVYPELGGVTITYVAGYGDTGAQVPYGVRQAILMMTSHLYNHRDAASDVVLTTVPLGVADHLSSTAWGAY